MGSIRLPPRPSFNGSTTRLAATTILPASRPSLTRVKELDAERQTQGNYLFYLATPPNVFGPITALLKEVNLSQPRNGGWTRVIIEKPFGHDLASAQALNEHLLHIFDEEQIYRIDHYLGKETVQNILVFRFGNGIFEPIWNRNYVDHVQITVAESLGVGSRGGYYDKSGAIRDMVQNHMMQLVALTAMEPPVTYDAESVRNQKVNVLRSIVPLDPLEVNKAVVRAQYEGGIVGGQAIPGYLESEGIPPQIDDRDLPRLAAGDRQLALEWRALLHPHGQDAAHQGDRDQRHVPPAAAHVLRQPPEPAAEGAQRDHPAHPARREHHPQLRRQAARAAVGCGAGEHGFHLLAAFDGQISDAYERLLLDAMLGDGTLFLRRDETELAWDRVTNVLEGWAIQEEIQRKRGRTLRLPQYPAIRGDPRVRTPCWSRRDITGAIRPTSAKVLKHERQQCTRTASTIQIVLRRQKRTHPGRQ